MALERPGQEGECRVAAGDRDARAQSGDRLGGDERAGRLGLVAGRVGEGGPKPGSEAVVADERERHRSTVDLRQQQARRRERRRGEPCVEGRELRRRAEEVLDARAERRRERERDLERGRPAAGLDPRDRLACHAGHVGERALGQAPRETCKPEAVVDPVVAGRHQPIFVLRAPRPVGRVP